MKNKKRIILIAMCLLLSGCSVEYNIEVGSETIKEEIVLYTDDKNEISTEDEPVEICEMYENQSSLYLESLNKKNITIEDYGVKYPGVEYYDLNYKEDNEKCSLIAKYDYQLKDYKYSESIPQYLEKINVKQKDGEYVIEAKNFNFFELYNGVKNFRISINTTLPVTYNNADEISGNSYIWNINANNYNKKTVSIKIKNGKTEETEEQIQSITTEEKIKENIVYIIGAIALIFVGIIAYVIASKKQNKY